MLPEQKKMNYCCGAFMSDRIVVIYIYLALKEFTSSKEFFKLIENKRDM